MVERRESLPPFGNGNEKNFSDAVTRNTGYLAERLSATMETVGLILPLTAPRESFIDDP